MSWEGQAPAPATAGKPSPRKTAPGTARTAADRAAPAAAGKTPDKTAPTAAEKATATKELPPNPERQIVLQGRTGTATAVTSAQASAVSWGFGPLKTLSGGSLGSLEQLHMDWNASDTSEVSSRTLAGQISDHPAGPSSVAQKLFAVKAALQEAERTTMVSTVDYIPLSPVPEIRVE